VHSYSRQPSKQYYLSTQQRSVSTRSIEGRDHYFAEIISFTSEQVTSKTDEINWCVDYSSEIGKATPMAR